MFKNSKQPTPESAINQLHKELGITARAFECPKCGSTLTIDPSHIQTFCQFCGGPLPKAEELLQQSYEYMEKNKDRELELKKLEYQSKKEKRKTVMKTLDTVNSFIQFLPVFFLVLLGIGVLIITGILLFKLNK